MNIPEGTEPISVEGGDLKSALISASETLGCDAKNVAHKLDLSHFRNASGSMRPMRTVKIFAWQSEEDLSANIVSAPKREARSDDRGERPERKDRGDRPERSDRGDRPERKDRGGRSERGDRGGRGRDRDDRGGRNRDDRGGRGGSRDRDDRGGRGRERGERRERKGAEEGTTEASDFVAAWFVTLLGHMDLKGVVTGTGNDERIHVDIKIDGRAGRLIGRRGITLRGIRHLLGVTLARHHGEFLLDVDVDDDRPADDRKPRREASEDRGGRSRDRNRGRSRDREEEKGRYPEDKIRALAARAADKAATTGQTITINLELNSYDRRLVHMEVAEHDGVASQSEEREVKDDDGNVTITKYVQVIPAPAEA